MTKRHLPGTLALFAALLVLTFVLGHAGESMAQHHKASVPDPDSTFRIGMAGATPTAIVEVPLRLETDNLVNYFTNHLGWNPDQLQLLSVTPGPGIPPDSGDFVVTDQQSDQVIFYFDTGVDPPIDIEPTDPVAILEFEVQCYGYGTSATIGFVGGTAVNYYNDEFGTSWGPVLTPGWVHSTINVVSFRGESLLTYPAREVTSAITFYTTIPGGPTDMILHYESDDLTVTAIDPGPGIDPADYDDSGSSPGVIDIHFLNPPVLEGEVHHEIFFITFATTPDADDYESTLTFDPDTGSINVCGDPEGILSLMPFTIEVPDHMADVTLADINPYRTAAYYDVPFVFDSTFPVDDYEFEVSFDTELTFDTAVPRGDFAFPIVTEIGPNLLHISEGFNPDPTEENIYVPDELPTTVFYLRFNAPSPQPPSGATFTVEFANLGDPQANKVAYEISAGPPPVMSFADITFENCTITTRNPPPPPPSCPTLFVWDGKQFARENTILAACTDGTIQAEVTDYYRITNAVVADDSGLRLQIREDHTAVSTFRDFELMAVDHAPEVSVRVTPEGEIMGLGPLHRIEWARDHRGRDVTELLLARDGVVYQAEGDGWIEVSFGVIRGGLENGLLAGNDFPPKDRIRKGGDPEPLAGPVEIAVRAQNGTWIPVGHSYPRYAPGRESTLVEPGLVPQGGKLMLRYTWQDFYRADAIEIQLAEPLERQPVSARLKGLTHTHRGSVLDGLASQSAVTLGPGQRLDLTFDASGLPALEDGTVRDYVFVATGRYVSPEERDEVTSVPLRTTLAANTPNPFNPSTTIKFSLAEPGDVSLRVYDVRGQLVRTLLAEHRASGEHALSWDGRNDQNREVASGVYYYKLLARGFEDTRKMLLMK